MKASNDIKKFIMSLEGFSAVAYKPLPTDRWTFGYGSTFNLDGTPVEERQTISKEDAETILNNTVDKIAHTIAQYAIPTSTTQNQFDAVVSLAYNIGVSAFIHSNTGKSFYQGTDISNDFIKWDISGGKVISGLINRRNREKDIYDNSNYTC